MRLRLAVGGWRLGMRIEFDLASGRGLRPLLLVAR